ncbi:MAG: toprim domain-containing protein [Rhizorhabdus sp.]
MRWTGCSCSQPSSMSLMGVFPRWKVSDQKNLAVYSLVRRTKAAGIDEVVLAMSATLEGQTTAHYVVERIKRFPVRVQQLAQGLPFGCELNHRRRHAGAGSSRPVSGRLTLRIGAPS